MRGVLQEELPLVERFVNEMQSSMFQVAEPAMDELGRDAARSRGKITLVNERDCQSPERCIQSNSRPGNPAAQDQEIESRVLKCFGDTLHAGIVSWPARRLQLGSMATILGLFRLVRIIDPHNPTLGKDGN